MTTTPTGLFDDATLLDNLAGLRRHRDRADQRIRDLVAYARTFVRPSPYRLADLATAAGMSMSGVRTCYRAATVARVADLIGLTPPERGSP